MQRGKRGLGTIGTEQFMVLLEPGSFRIQNTNAEPNVIFCANIRKKGTSFSVDFSESMLSYKTVGKYVAPWTAAEIHFIQKWSVPFELM